MAWRQLLPFLVVLPFWTSFLIRVSAGIAILKPSGPLNRLMLTAWLTKAPLSLLNNAFSGAPVDVLARVTLPGISPALVSGWLLYYPVARRPRLASFVTGPSAMTLPMAVFSSVRLGISLRSTRWSHYFSPWSSCRWGLPSC